MTFLMCASAEYISHVLILSLLFAIQKYVSLTFFQKNSTLKDREQLCTQCITLQVVVNYEGTDIILGVSKPQSQYHFIPPRFS